MRRYAFTLADARHFTVEEMISIAQAADRAGFEALWIGETWGWDVGMLLAIFARSASRIKLGAAILNIYARTPSAIAQHAATLDILSGGRAVVGLGIATPAIVQDWHGVPFDRPYQHLKEATEIVRQALTGRRLDYDGEIFKVSRFKLTVPPVQERIPIVLATSKRRNVELTGRIADGWAPAFSSPATIPILRAYVDEGARSVGRDPASVFSMPSVRVAVTDDPEPARRLLRRVGTHVSDLYGDRTRWRRPPGLKPRAKRRNRLKPVGVGPPRQGCGQSKPPALRPAAVS